MKSRGVNIATAARSLGCAKSRLRIYLADSPRCPVTPKMQIFAQMVGTVAAARTEKKKKGRLYCSTVRRSNVDSSIIMHHPSPHLSLPRLPALSVGHITAACLVLYKLTFVGGFTMTRGTQANG
jgi:hypothetical protein